MGGIPIISDIIDLITGFFQILPNYLKLLVFLGVVALFVTMVSVLFDTFNWQHPRVFQSADCVKAGTVIYNTYYNSTELSQLSEENCTRLRDCINGYANTYNLSCNQCRCTISLYGKWNVECLTSIFYPQPIFAEGTCSMAVINETGETVIYKCLNVINPNSSYVAYFNKLAECKNSGLDLLNAGYLWGATILIACIEGTLKIFQIMRVF